MLREALSVARLRDLAVLREAAAAATELRSEVVRLRHEVTEARAAAVSAPLSEARLLGIFGGRAIPGQWRSMVHQANVDVSVAAFTFDSELLTEALIEARTRRGTPSPRCRLLMCGEYADRGNMANWGPRLQRLRSHGVLVRFYRAGHRLHQKSMLADDRIYLGSMNFSDASRAYAERGAILRLTQAEARGKLNAYDALWAEGRDG